MQTSAKSTEASAARRAASATWTTGAASRLAPMRLSRRSISSAPVTTRRTRRMPSHFAARRGVVPVARGGGEVDCRWTELSSPGKRASQTSSMVKGSIGASQVTRRWKSASSTVRAARRRGLVGGVAVERVLADVEVEGREVDGGELEEASGRRAGSRRRRSPSRTSSSSSARRCSTQRSSSGISAGSTRSASSKPSRAPSRKRRVLRRRR